MVKKIDNFCLTLDQAAEAKKKFIKSFYGREERFKKELNKVCHILNNDKMVTPSDYPQLAILHGLELSFNQRQSLHKLPENYHHFAFFAHLYNLTCDSMDEAGKKSLEGKVIAGIKDYRHLTSLFLELIVREIYCSNKCVVSFNDLDANTIGTYDLHVNKSSLSYAVEIKTISIDSGLPIEREWICQSIYSIIHEYSDAERNGGAFQIDVTFKGNRSTPHEKIKNSLTAVLVNLKKRQGSMGDDIFHITVKKISLEKFQKNQNKFQEAFYQAAKDGLNLLQQGFSPYNQLPTCLSFFAQEKWKLPEKITNVIKKAVNEQLPKNGMSVLWVSVVGLTTFVDNPKFVLDDLCSVDNLIYKELYKRKYNHSLDSGLIGIHFMGDVTTVINNENKMFLTFPKNFLSIEENSPETNMYLMIAMDLTAKDLH